MASASNSTRLVAETEATGTLARGTLRTWDAVAISVSILAPGMAMQLNTGGVAAQAGGSTPMAFLLGGIACLTLAFVVIGFTRRMASAGYAYTYASRSLGPGAGFLSGWLYAFGMACFVPMTMAGVGALTADLLGLDVNAWWFLFFVIGMALLVVLSVVRIHVTTRLQLFIGAATVAILVAVNLVIMTKGGSKGLSLAPFSFNHTATGGFNGVFYGIILGVTSYIGFETAADFGEETANPRRAIPIAVLASVVFAIALYLWTTYSATVGFGVTALAHDPSPWVTNGIAQVARSYGGAVLADLVEIGALFSAFVVCVGCATAGSRTLFAMGREGVLPRWFSHTHPRFQTPVNATASVAVVSTAVAALVGYTLYVPAVASRPFIVYYVMATIGTLAIILVYIALCLGGVVFFRRSGRFNPLLHGLVPLVGAAIFAAAWYGSVYPIPVWPIRIAPYVAGVWFVIGIAALLYLRLARPEAVSRIGSILGEEGGEF